ncbi:MAG: dTDP-4-dehydrorhamnose 3,5-epimerase [Deltaproteobacteria bacterium]|nr:dTDP-4-dehydrorhamnose 3,5-epimerase [Deltaproteobacteria bacterium]
MNVSKTPLPGVLLIEPRVFSDARGFFLETWQQTRYREAGLPLQFVQDNLSSSSHGTLRGLHFQYPRAQGKLIYVVHGTIFDVAVDIRVGSPTFGQSYDVELSSANNRQLYIPEGFAHGFCVVSEQAIVMYKCTDFYVPTDEGGVLWSDPDLAIPWPVRAPTLSDKDQRYPLLRDIPVDRLPRYVKGRN